MVPEQEIEPGPVSTEVKMIIEYKTPQLETRREKPLWLEIVQVIFSGALLIGVLMVGYYVYFLWYLGSLGFVDH